MTHPEQAPDRLGLPCWKSDRPDLFLQTVARVAKEDADSFLASHSPINGIKSKDGSKTEVEVFDWLFKRKGAETLLVVTGEPGSGKSHFINWLKLRLDDSLRRNEKKQIRSVLVKRRSGSLRDALEQLLEQLGDFESYLAPVRAALENLSPETAKRALCFELSNLIRENPIANDRRLADLHEFFNDTGSLRWLCRHGGAIDRNVHRLISESRLEERESFPLLNIEDFLIRDPSILRRVGPTVQELQDNLECDIDRCQKACDRANELLRPALERLTGLGNQTLHQIFRDVRKDLHNRGESLALFIEDVSTLSALDTEVVNALEPQNDSSLCRLYGVLGMTNQALQRLPQNMRERIDLELEIAGSDTHSPLRTSSDYSDAFVARYLNALRLSDGDIERLAQFRRQGRDVCVSACDECSFRTDCFRSFGSVHIEETELGLFPFRRGALLRLLDGLREEGVVRKNSRGLLQQVVVPVLTAVDHGLDRSYPNMGLAVDPRIPEDMDSASARYLGGWDDKSKQRLRFLLWYWVGETTIERGASALDLLRSVFGLPQFTQAPIPPPKLEGLTAGAKPTAATSIQVVQDPVYERLSERLEKWVTSGDKLREDNLFRELILPLVKRSIPWDDLRSPAWPARSRVAECNTNSIAIEDMLANPAMGGMRFPVLVRSEETSSLLRAVLRFRYLGRRSWSYPEQVFDKRTIGRWLRAQSSVVVKTPDPVDLDPKVALECAIRFLLIAYQLCKKKALPNELSEAVSVLISFTPDVPFAFSPALKKIADDLPERVSRIREFVWSELNIPQGATGGINLIDPLSIISAISSYRDSCALPQVDERFATSHWQARFGAVTALSRTSWFALEAALSEELGLLTARLNATRVKLASWGLASELVDERIEEFVTGCKGIKKALADIQEPLGNEQVSKILSRSDNPEKQWAKALRDLESMSNGENLLDVLRFDSGGFSNLETSLECLVSWVEQLQESVNERYAIGTGGGNLDDEIALANIALDSISILGEVS